MSAGKRLRNNTETVLVITVYSNSEINQRKQHVIVFELEVGFYHCYRVQILIHVLANKPFLWQDGNST